MNDKRSTINILGINIDNVSLNEAVNRVVKMTKDGQKHYVVTPNPEMVVRAQKDAEFRKILNGADLAIPDGIGLVWASKVKGKRFKVKGQNLPLTPYPLHLIHRVPGVDLVEKLCQMAAEKGLTVGFLGGRGEVAGITSEKLLQKYPGLKVAFALSSDPDDALKEIGRTRDTSFIDFLFVAYGAGKQEKWIANRISEVPAKVLIGVGGAFDYLSGKAVRAPKLIRNIGLEWLWRLINQPWRLKRQLALVKFVWLVLIQKKKQ